MTRTEAEKIVDKYLSAKEKTCYIDDRIINVDGLKCHIKINTYSEAIYVDLIEENKTTVIRTERIDRADQLVDAIKKVSRRGEGGIYDIRIH